jgi:hypothetical protein
LLGADLMEAGTLESHWKAFHLIGTDAEAAESAEKPDSLRLGVS